MNPVHRVVPLLLLLLALPASADTRGFVFTTDYQTGSLSAVDLDTRARDNDVANGICSDARLRWHEGLLYVINRLNCDNILVLDPANDFAVVRQISTGNGTNPSDIVFITPTKAYVTCYETSDVLIIDPTTGSITGSISLMPFVDQDGIPEMDRAIRVGDRVFVSLQRLSRPSFASNLTSMVAVIDTRTDTLVDADPVFNSGVQPIFLAARNPVTSFAWDPVSQRLLLGCTGTYGQVDGGFVWIDPETYANGLAIPGSAFGGDIHDVAWDRADHSYAIVTDLSFNARLVAFDPSAGVVLDTLLEKNGFSLGDAEVNDRGELYVCDNDFFDPGLRVFSTATEQQLAGPLPTGLPPNQITFDRTSNIPAGVTSPMDAPVAWLAPAPNPARASARLSFTVARASRVRIDVMDVSGRVVRSFGDRAYEPGVHGLAWDLSGASGERVRPGIYLARLTMAGGSVSFSDRNRLVTRVCVLN